MSKKNRNSWQKQNPTQSPVVAPAAEAAAPVAKQTTSISAAQLAANQANAQLSTGPRTATGLAKSSLNAVKSALTGRTVLLPTDDGEEYAALIADFQSEFNPVGQLERELVQIIVDCYWRLRRIQELEYAFYAQGERQFAEAFADEPAETRRSMLMLQTHLTYQKELRNLHIQESRIDRKRTKAQNELDGLQTERTRAAEESRPEEYMEDLPDKEYFDALDAGYLPPSIAKVLAERKAANQNVDPNGFVFSNTDSAAAEVPTGHSQAA